MILKNLKSIFSIIICFVLIISCDDSIEPNDNLESELPEMTLPINQKIIDLSQSEHFSKLQPKIKGIKNLLGLKSGKNEENDIEISTNDILFVEYDETFSYTFKIKKEKPDYYIENAVLLFNKETKDFDEFLVQYNVSSEELLAIVDREPFSDSESVIITPLSKGFISENLNARCTRSCETVFVNCSSGQHHKGNIQDWVTCNANSQPFTYQSCTMVCDNQDPFLDDGSGNFGSNGGGGSKIVTQPSPGTTCTSADGTGIVNTNGECYVDEYKIDNTLLTGKEKCINDLLDNTNNSFLENLLKQFDGNSEFNISIKSKNKVYKDGIEVNGKTSYNPTTNKITIEISSNKAQNRSVLSVARTIIHEYIHADIFRKVYTKNTAPSGDAKFRTTYEKYKSEIFKANVQHNTMAELYQESIAQTLKTFHKSKMYRDWKFLSNNGIINLDIYYEALSWQGLRNDHEVYWEIVPDIRKQALKDALIRFDVASTKNCN